MEFFASLTINRCHIDKLCSISERVSGRTFPFSHVLVSPLVLRRGILPIIYKHRHQCTVMFDSGGFHIQQRLLNIKDASMRLATFYKTHEWADLYVIPDVPLTCRDSARQIRQKLRVTTEAGSKFAEGVPQKIRSKLLPVVHGTTSAHIQRSVSAALKLNPRCLGFGSFGTSGARSGVNCLTKKSLSTLQVFSRLCTRHHVRSHAFGVGGPASMCVLRYVPIDSFDTAGWVRAAAYGHIYLPFVGAVNITGKSRSHRYMSKAEYRRTAASTLHRCEYCSDHSLLQDSWYYRALHNYIVLAELSHRLTMMHISETIKHLMRYNPRYASYLRTCTCS